MVKLVNTLDSGSSEATLAGSSPVIHTTHQKSPNGLFYTFISLVGTRRHHGPILGW